MKTAFLTAAAALTLAACNSGAPTYITTGDAPMAKIQVSATGTANMAPDMATVPCSAMPQR